MDSECGSSFGQNGYNIMDAYIKATSRDAFGRFRISEPFTLFDSQQRYIDNRKFSSATSGSGAVTHLPNESALKMDVTNASGDYVYLESKRVMAYQPGKSLLVMMSFVFATPKANLRQRIGYFGTQNGIYLEQDGTSLYLVLRSYVSGSVNNSRKIPQSEWNGHKFDGSTFNPRQIDVTKGNILWMDVEWLGVGDIRCGFIIDGVPVIAHIFHNENLYSTTYMTTGTLPLRAELENTSGTSGSSTMRMICATVISEGGYQSFSTLDYASSSIVATNYKTLTTAGTYYPMVSIRLKQNRLDSVVLPIQLDFLGHTSDNFLWKLLLNPTLNSTAGFTDHSTNSSLEIDTSATSMSDLGTTLQAGLVYQKTSTILSTITNFNFQVGRTIQGTSDIMTIAVVASANNAKCVTGIGWMELV
jgi:hypothetical protein